MKINKITASKSDITLSHDLNDSEINSVVNELKFATKNVEIFFSTSSDNKIDFTVTMVSSRSEYDKFLGRPTESWECGWVKPGEVIIFSPEAYICETSHPVGQYVKTLTHEICHIFTLKITQCPLFWLNEGIADYIADIRYNNHVSTSNLDHFFANHLFSNINYSEFIQYEGYRIGYTITKYLIEHYGKEKLFLLLDSDRDKAKMTFLKAINKNECEFRKELDDLFA
ncbi:MAG: hypothetical protein WCG48_02545 [Candidatus Berkelbacteria bacterium]